MGMPAGVVASHFLKRLPAFSPVAVRLMSLVADENVSLKEVAKLITLDPVLSGETLRMANSGLYGRRQPVQSVLHAIAMVGLHRLTRLAVTAALWRGMPNRTSSFMKAWWRHSVAAALIAEHSSRLGIDYAYTAGLLHGVGQLALFEHAPQDYIRLLNDAVSSNLDLQESERAAFGTDHAELAGVVLEAWALPEVVQDAVALHHWPNPGSELADAVQIGCLAAEHIGFGACGCHRQLAAEDFSTPVASVIGNKHLLEVFAVEVNGIECSLM
ncbi:MAG: metal dependent phosphohydrolase [Bryobacterales bacterium]|jgi:HD-like signal output (HDOD) protein|nr:metal dependent phosphohydrolase [Bryobacterales bacterium]